MCCFCHTSAWVSHRCAYAPSLLNLLSTSHHIPPLCVTEHRARAPCIIQQIPPLICLFIFLGSEITADGDCSHEIKRHLLLGRKAMTNLDSTLKSRDINLPTMVHIVKAVVFPVVRYGCESWTINKAEFWRINAFELWCWRRLLRVPWTARRSNQSILKEISPEYSLEGLILKLKLQYFGYLLQRTDLFEKTLMLRKIEGRRIRGRQMIGWVDGITTSMDMSWVNTRSWLWTGKPEVLQSIGSQRDRTELLNSTDIHYKMSYMFCLKILSSIISKIF